MIINNLINNMSKKIVIPIVVLVIMGGIAIYAFSIQNRPIDCCHGEQYKNPPQVDTSDWKTYSNSNLSFKYPPLLSLEKQGETIGLSHSIVYKHPDVCDFTGDAPPRERLYDFGFNFSVVNSSVKDWVQSFEYPGWDYVSSNPYKLGSWNGYKISEGIEGCGMDKYYFFISPAKTLVIDRAIVTEFNPIVGNYQTYLNLTGVISPSQADEFFTKILSTFKFEK